VVIGVDPWYDPRYLIPIGGMILGNAMTGASLAGERFQGELRARVDEVETLLALGFSGLEAVRDLYRSAIRAAMIPTINAMLAVGIVQLPGMMTGQILSGTSPLIAVKYQALVMLMITCAVALSSFLFLRLALRRYLTPAHQLRRSLIQ
jgi:putative ABC transport system permease protein